MKFEQILITGPTDDHRNIEECAVFSTVDALNKQANNGAQVQGQIDRYMLYMFMFAIRSPLLEAGTPEMFITDPQHVFSTLHLPDIGRFISKLVTNQQNTSSDLMSRLIHYSMPYIKHNRMNFPSFSPEHASVLPDIVNIILANCLGLYPHCNKKPVLALRVKLIAFTHTLKARGTAVDMYIFCTSNMCLLRIAMIEYFVFFVSSYMPNETLMLTQVFGLHQDIHDIFKQFTIICDTFRHIAMQTSVLDMSDINLKAQIAIDKCNRVCKGKSRSHGVPVARPSTQTFGNSVQLQALRTPAFAHICYAMLATPCLKLPGAYRIKQIHDFIGLYQLPYNIRHAQLTKIKNIIHNDTLNALSTMSMKICLTCVSRNRVCLDPGMRVMANGRASCTVCKDHSCVVGICTVGRIVRIRDTSFYYCIYCMRVHTWKSLGTEFSGCESAVSARQPLAPVRSCHFCAKINSVNTIRVLDDELGVIQEVPLCQRHMPMEHALRWVDNLEHLRVAVSAKLQRVNFR